MFDYIHHILKCARKNLPGIPYKISEWTPHCKSRACDLAIYLAPHYISPTFPLELILYSGSQWRFGILIRAVVFILFSLTIAHCPNREWKESCDVHMDFVFSRTFFERSVARIGWEIRVWAATGHTVRIRAGRYALLDCSGAPIFLFTIA